MLQAWPKKIFFLNTYLSTTRGWIELTFILSTETIMKLLPYDETKYVDQKEKESYFWSVLGS